MHILDRQFVGTGTLGNCRNLFGQAGQRILIGIIDGRHHQSHVGSNGYAKIDALLDKNLIIFRPARIDHGEFANSLADGFHHKWYIADAIAFTPLELFLVFLQPPGNVGHIDLHYRGSVRRCAFAAHHMFGNCQAHTAGRYYLYILSCYSCGCRRNKAGTYGSSSGLRHLSGWLCILSSGSSGGRNGLPLFHVR